jgi:hypothetical protein
MCKYVNLLDSMVNGDHAVHCNIGGMNVVSCLQGFTMIWNAATDDLNGPNKKKPVDSYEQACQNAETANSNLSTSSSVN